MTATVAACPTSVRIAVPADREELFSFVWEGHEETNYATKDRDKILGVIVSATNLRRNPVFGIIRGRSGIEAAVGLYISTWWYSNDCALMNFFWLVHPEHRKTKHAADLKAFCRWFAQQIGMPLVLTHWGDQTNGKAKLFGRDTQHVGSMFAQGLLQ